MKNLHKEKARARRDGYFKAQHESRRPKHGSRKRGGRR